MRCDWKKTINEGTLTACVVPLDLFTSHKASNATKDRGRLQGRGDKIPVAVDLDHEDADLEGTVDFAVLHQMAANDTIFDVQVVEDSRETARRRRSRRDRGRSRARREVGGDGSGTCTMLSGMTPGRVVALPAQARRNVAGTCIALVDILAQVEFDDAKGDSLVAATADATGGELLQHLELDGTLGQDVVLVDADADVTNNDGVIVVNPMVDDGRFRGATAMVSMDGVG